MTPLDWLELAQQRERITKLLLVIRAFEKELNEVKIWLDDLDFRLRYAQEDDDNEN